ncbi:DUF1501 domain-containing protein [Chondromyces apiculatus]|uniref:DUF1501 domain-containing protein n=1 Tax=Chondromyces apiculatus DSM 436 TaxID=1192034 RepID=A0A017TAC4_9BACT|nr:DUF1501 domain-containing protein [Chondromyces apiculatus]EYF05785.1 Hypothetical protein CAP_2786 [Chondromyces apiculatus DSM 436]
MSDTERRMGRRTLLGLGAGCAVSLLGARLQGIGEAHAQSAQGPGRAAGTPGRATPTSPPRACIVLWLNGGPSHVDTFDPKPGAPGGGPFKAIKTSARGVRISEHLPQLAAQAHRMAIVRGMISKEGSHQRAQYLMHTGYAPNPTVDHPCLGGYVSHAAGLAAGELPSFVSLGGPSEGGGFLGVQHGPLLVPEPGAMPRHVSFPPNVDDTRFDRRKAALAALELDFVARTGDPKIHDRGAVHERAVAMLRSPRLRAFDASEEPEAVRKAYGDTPFGRGCLTARRLLEAGVRYVEVVLDGWDTHDDNFGRVKKLMGTLDPAMATLLRELDARRLLDTTLVVCMGEFGRTPRVSARDGRDHHPQAWSAVLAGAGIRGGIAHGETDADGARVTKDPTSVPDLFATIATQIGLDPERTFGTPIGRPISITDSGKPVAALLRA